ncbi:pantoate--beta-alanine ligase [Stenotrophomonas ginsengisoli]|uniref:Pantothenate synthetase n=1 Tax=Stenotrophomonas ginsengisoli TaxID=336566 RepID=A0A0R0D9T0_9GAMM|nr:pantoate--beta-alanine ligase [Stenotrophomonas ginsengisoli]KRG74654.1 pantoate--beta-alanine ligase [Stenotrophomonas ginsengisoli]
MIETVTEIKRLRALVRSWKKEGKRVALVPTMGNLHEGHFTLVRQARRHADKVVASVFVNPTQFGPNEDFDRYPRTPQADVEGLAAAGCDLAWMPSVEQMYPLGVDMTTRISVPGTVTAVLEGASRPGHFDGVCTVVSRLFNQVTPDVALFGKKDYQQLAVIRQLVAELQFPLEVIGAEIVREDDGLARSSRNQYLGEAERAAAPQLHRVLREMRAACAAGLPRQLVEQSAAAALGEAGFVVDYAVVRQRDLAEPVDGQAGERVALLAARIGSTRLIDNLEF